MDPLFWLAEALAALDAQSLRRRLTSHAGPQRAIMRMDGREYVNFGANDYLALAADPRIAEAVQEAVRTHGWGAGASPLVTGRSDLHAELEHRLAEFEGAEAALVFGSGYAANVGTVSALVGPGDSVYSDALNHASLIDGCRLSRAAIHVYRHDDADHLEELLRANTSSGLRLIVTDGLFSMDGDLAPLPELCDLAEQYQCMLLVDEAHATGVFGANGRGVAEHLGVEDRIHIQVGTLSKALGSIGGFVVGRRQLIDWLANRARAYVFSTAPPAAACAAGLRALEIVRDEPWRRQQLLARAAGLRAQLREANVVFGPSAGQIIPIILGTSERALECAARLRERGLWTPAIRPPTVPEGRACLRISLTAGHTDEMVNRLAEELVNCQTSNPA